MKKKIFSLLLLLFLSSCGYEAKLSTKNRDIYNFTIKEYSFTGHRQTNLKIKQMLSFYTSAKEGNNFVLNISSEYEKVITAKNASGDATIFKNIATVDVEAILNTNTTYKFQIIEYFVYDNISNTFELREYENEITNNLAESITNKIILKLKETQWY